MSNRGRSGACSLLCCEDRAEAIAITPVGGCLRAGDPRCVPCAHNMVEDRRQNNCLGDGRNDGGLCALRRPRHAPRGNPGAVHALVWGVTKDGAAPDMSSELQSPACNRRGSNLNVVCGLGEPQCGCPLAAPRDAPARRALWERAGSGDGRGTGLLASSRELPFAAQSSAL